jgi:hypothetical protein
MNKSARALSEFPAPSFSAATPFAAAMTPYPDHPNRPPAKPEERGYWHHDCPDSSAKLECIPK